MLRIKCRSLITFLFVYITGASIVLCTNGCSESGAHKDGSKLLEDGIRNFNTNNIVKAFSELQLAAVELKNDGDLDGHFEACVYLAMVYDQIGQRDQAYKILNSIEFKMFLIIKITVLNIIFALWAIIRPYLIRTMLKQKSSHVMR